MFDPNDSFKNHLAKIEFAKQRALEIFAHFGVATETAIASLSRAWEMLFDSICASSDGSIDELKNISAVIQKLSSSHQKIQEIELKKVEKFSTLAVAEEARKAHDANDALGRDRLPNEVVKIVEEQLQLL